MATQENQAIIDRINAAVSAGDVGFGLETHEVQGPTKAQVLYQDRTYKNKPLLDGMELTFKGVRGAARKTFIFEFLPTDAQEFVQVEFDDSMVFDTVKGFEDKLVVALVGAERAASVANMRFTEACNLFKRQAKKIAEEEAKRQAELQAQAEKDADAAYSADPMYGAF